MQNTQKDPSKTFIGGLVIGWILSGITTFGLCMTWFSNIINQ